MSLTLNMVGGFGGRISGSDAVLQVTAPINSTVTATDGTSTKSVQSSDSHVSSTDNTVAIYIFTFKSSEFGTWSVTATLGTDTTTETISISENKVYQLQLQYEIWLIKDGLFVSGYNHAVSGYTSATVDQNYSGGGYVRLHSPKSASTRAFLHFYKGSSDVRSIPLTSYNYIVCEHRVKGHGSDATIPAYGAATSLGSSSSDPSYSAYHGFGTSSISSLTSRATTYVDISSLTGDYWVGFNEGGNANTDGEFDCYNLYLSKVHP